MSPSVEALQRFGLKLFFRSKVGVEPRSFIPVFHRWIQTGAVGGLLIDVADYTHLVDGPGVLLVGHEGNYALDFRNGRPGLYYYRKQPADGTLGERIVALGRTVLEAGCLLETDDALGPNLRFRGDELEFVANDRLVAPPNDDTAEALRPVLSGFLDTLYQDQDHDVSRSASGGDLLTFSLRAANDVSVSTLLARIT